MSELFGIEITDEQWDYLMCEQNKGKELKVVDGKVVAVEHTPSKKDLAEKELFELKSWFDEYDNQVKQYIRCERLGIEFDKDINKLDLQAQTNAKRIKEIRGILGGKK